jgi:F0F1-type ATP synthase membrane subunit b/b'
LRHNYNAMEEIRIHIQDNLTTAEHAYEDAFNRLDNAKKKLAEANEEVSRYTWDMKSAEKNINYFQRLLNELNEGTLKEFKE